MLGRYSRDRGLFPLETAVHKMTGLPARRLGLHGRGLIAAGQAADLLLFDPHAMRDNASCEDPRAQPSGIVAVFVNGRLALWQGQQLDVRAGRLLAPSGP